MNAMFDVKTLIEEADYGTPASRSEKTVTLTIDGRTVTAPEGTSIMRAAMDAGVEIPKLCATDMLDAFGSCRFCLVWIMNIRQQTKPKLLLYFSQYFHALIKTRTIVIF